MQFNVKRFRSNMNIRLLNHVSGCYLGKNDNFGSNKGLPEPTEYAIICPQFILSGRSAVRLARLHGVQEVGGSNPLAPTKIIGSSSSLSDGELVFLGHLFKLVMGIFYRRHI